MSKVCQLLLYVTDLCNSWHTWKCYLIFISPKPCKNIIFWQVFLPFSNLNPIFLSLIIGIMYIWWRTDAFELWCWRRLLRVPWTARRSNQSILKEISPGCSLEGLMLKLKLQYFGHLMRRVDSLEKTDAGRDWGQEEKETAGDEMAGWHHWLDGHESEWTPGDGDGQGGLACCDSWGHKELDTTERLATDLIWSDIWWIYTIYIRILVLKLSP